MVLPAETGGMSAGCGEVSSSTHPSGGEIITMLPHLGHSWICPKATRFRTAMRARQVVQDTENSGFSTIDAPLPAARGIQRVPTAPPGYVQLYGAEGVLSCYFRSLFYHFWI